MNEPSRNNLSPSNRGVLPLILGAVALVILLVGAVYAGYYLGQRDSTPAAAAAKPPQPIVEVSTTPSATSESAASLDEPVPTATPTAVQTATQTQIVDKIVPPDMPAVSETVVPDDPNSETDDDSPAGSVVDLDLSTFYEVWGLIEDEFDGELPEDSDLLYGAIGGSINALEDPFTRFIRPEIAERLRDDLDGSVSGIGAIVRPGEDGAVEIVRPIDNQPADLAGLRAGDLIVAVDGDSVEGKTFDEVLLAIRGPEGTVVNLTVFREGERDLLEFSMERAEFEVPIVESQLLEEDSQTIAYVRLSSFTHTAEDDVINALTGLLAQNPAGIIFDLRDNGGGFLDQAVAVSDLFLPEGVVLYERSTKGELNETFYSDDGDLAEELPLVVLVNAGSASASEIFAGAVQDNGRGVIIGEQTFGKGSVQHVHTLSDGSELRVTIARWYTPNDRSISEEGVTPDIEVETPDDLGGEDDLQLQSAIDYIIGNQ
ncbi:MAG: S41 family peptidase [Candidatus Promineifilaceae bacterium]